MVIYPHTGLPYPISTTNPLRIFFIGGLFFEYLKECAPPPNIKTYCPMSHLFLTLPCGFKAAQCSSQPIPSGRRVPIFRSGVGCGFRLWPRWETASRFDCKFRVAFSAQALNRKPCPVSQPNTGMHFPLSPSTGKCIPFHSQIPGRAFRNSAHPESPSHRAYIRAWSYQPSC